jgi:hypothetical protein
MYFTQTGNEVAVTPNAIVKNYQTRKPRLVSVFYLTENKNYIMTDRNICPTKINYVSKGKFFPKYDEES